MKDAEFIAQLQAHLKTEPSAFEQEALLKPRAMALRESSLLMLQTSDGSKKKTLDAELTYDLLSDLAELMRSIEAAMERVTSLAFGRQDVEGSPATFAAARALTRAARTRRLNIELAATAAHKLMLQDNLIKLTKPLQNIVKDQKQLLKDMQVWNYRIAVIDQVVNTGLSLGFAVSAFL